MQDKVEISGPLFAEESLPVLIHAVNGCSLLEWAKANRELIELVLLQHGAILLRGFGISGVEGFREFAEVTASEGLMGYVFGSTSRKRISDNIYTSTEYPPNETIPVHNEMSYNHIWPMKLLFYCARAAFKGGATPIAKSARVFELIDPAIRDEFIQRGVMYVRNYRENMDLSIKEVFGTTSAAEIVQICREAGIECDFRGDVLLRTRQRSHAVAVHPKSGRTVWFNQAHLFHISNLDPRLSQQLVSIYGLENLPRNCYYGDGSPIGAEDLRTVREAYQKASVRFQWEEGDLLMLDNMLAAHGRDPFVGERRILVSMADPCRASDLGSVKE